MNIRPFAALAAVAFVWAVPAFAGSPVPALPHWTFSPEMVFPSDRSLHRPEDGVVLPDGRLIVSDQLSGLVLINPDGSTQPFGKFADAGYRHAPPDIVSTINGVSLEPDGKHLLGADVFRGGLYRVNVATGAVEKIYQHPFGINTARADRRGGIWFSQSTRNGPEFGERDLFKSVDMPTPDGALFYLPPAKDDEARVAVQVAGDILFANGLVLDEDAGFLYLSETFKRVIRYRVDTTAGTVSEPTTVVDGIMPDNLDLDEHNRLWIALPITSEIAVLDLATGKLEKVFSLQTPEKAAILETVNARLKAGESWLELFGPDLWDPAPGAITGMILSPNDGTVYASTIGNALIRLER